MLRLRVIAPFAAFRTFSAGAYRATAPFITPSAAYGLLLNVAAIETRLYDEESPATLTAFNLPKAEVALGAVRLPSIQTIYQQLHNYPVNESNSRADEAKGQKLNIQPIRREYLVDLDGYICLRGNDELEDRVRNGLASGANYAPEGKLRYGLPFLGDNNFTLSHLHEEVRPEPAMWFVLATREQGAELPNPSRLTVWIDRADSSRSVIRLFGRSDGSSLDVPDQAWTPIRPPAG